MENVASILANGGKTRSSNSRSRKIINKVTKKGAASSVASNGTDSCTASTKSKDTRLVGNETAKVDGRAGKLSMKRQRKDSDSVGEILRALLDVPPGSRHGRKVFHVRDPKRVVGEVRKIARSINIACHENMLM